MTALAEGDNDLAVGELVLGFGFSVLFITLSKPFIDCSSTVLESAAISTGMVASWVEFEAIPLQSFPEIYVYVNKVLSCFIFFRN